MKLFQLKNLFLVIAVLTVLSACRKKDVTPEDQTLPGVYVLSQGSFNGNNSALTYYSFPTTVITPNKFSAVNGTGLGDTGNDAKIYGSKMYIVVNVSSTIEVVDAKTTKSIKQIKLFNGAVARQPRYVVFNKNKALISSYDGTIAVLDTATLTVDKYITVGRNPEQLVISNNKLYVANSGGLTFGNPDNTVSVVDLNTLTETKKITVPSNPINVTADAYGDVYVISYGTAYPAKPSLTIIDNATDAVKSTIDFDAGYATSLTVSGDNAYFVNGANKVKVYNVKTETIASTDFITDGTVIAIPYAIAVNAAGDVFVTDAINYSSNGLLFAFDSNGKKKYKDGIPVGINPGCIVFVNK